MTALGQAELFVPAPRRRMIVGKGQTAWWGVDPSTRRLALAGVSAEGGWAHQVPFVKLSGAPRLAAIRAETMHLVTLAAESYALPGVVAVEQPGGKSINWPLYLAVGVIVEAVYEALLPFCGGVEVELIAPATWKKRACGRGDIYKPKRGDSHEYGVLTWAREQGYAGSSWDEADAWGIAEAMRRDVLLEAR